MKKTLVVSLLTALAVSATAMGVTWNLVGSTGSSAAISQLHDYQRILAHDIIADGTGNVYVAQATDHGGGSGYNNQGVVTVFPAGGGAPSTIDLGTTGMITKMVVAGDGKVYGLQNYRELQWNYASGNDSRIVRVEANGTVTPVVTKATSGQGANLNNEITSLTVGGDGNLYFSQASKYTKTGRFFKYDLGSSTESLYFAGDFGGSQDSKGGSTVEYMGNDTFAYVYTKSSTDLYHVTATTRTSKGSFSGGWGRAGFNWSGVVYDAVQDTVWVPSRGDAGRNIMVRYRNASTTPVMDAWHVINDQDNGAQWFSGFDTDGNGDAWFGYMGDDSSSNGLVQAMRGHVWRYDTYLGLHDEGVPEMGADVYSVKYVNGGMYALVADSTTGAYKLYTTLAVPEPVSMIFLALGSMFCLRRRR